MRVVYIDFESFYDSDYTLKNMTPYEYILDYRWETIGCGFALNDGPVEFYPGDEIAQILQELPRPYACVSYNALFDASILAFRYGIHPDVLIDAMGIVRATLLHRVRNGRVSLANISKVLGLPEKKVGVLKNASGMRRADLEARPQLWEEYKQYCRQDTDNCRMITQILGKQYPKEQIWVMDAILRMCTRPNFLADVPHLKAHLSDIQASKESLLQRVGLTRGDLLSADKFADALKALGVEPPTKLSLSAAEKGETKHIYAFAQSDANFRELEDHENPDVQALVAARLGIKSTMEERRAERFIGMAEAAQSAFGTPWMPVALGYGKAHTHRFGGEWSVNMQNLPSRKSRKLRESFVAPAGYKVVSVDASQIEARLVAWLAGEVELLATFAAGEDVYCWFGTDLFRRVITKGDKIERFCSKEIVLGLGFQMGAWKLYLNINAKAKDFGFTEEFTVRQCEVWVEFYRGKFKRIKNLWWQTQQMLKQLCQMNAPQFQLGPSYTEGTDLVLPTGLRLYYDNMREEDGEIFFDYGRERKKIYGGKFTENHVQSLDNAHVMDAAMRIDKKCKQFMLPNIRLAHQVHDELIYVVPDGLVATLGVIAYDEMRTPAWWGSGLPLDAGVSIGQSYGSKKEVLIAELREGVWHA